jgi:hypothetical protein
VQYYYTFDNPEVKNVRVNVILEQEDLRMMKAGALFPPFSEKRMKIGLVVIEMSKA